MHRLACLTAVAVAALAAACAELPSSLEPGLDELEPGGEPVAVTRLQQHPSIYSGLDEAARVVVESQEEWQEVWVRMWRNRQPLPALPAVDFSSELVIVAAMGARSTGGYAIQVDAARAYGDHLTVHAVETSPGTRCVVTQAFSAPVDVVTIPRTPLPIRFRTTKTVHDCR